MAIAGFICGYLSIILIPWFAYSCIQVRNESIEKAMLGEARLVSNVCQQYFMKHGTTTAPVADIMYDAGPLCQGQTLVAPKTEFEAHGTFTLHHSLVGNITYYVDSGDTTGR